MHAPYKATLMCSLSTEPSLQPLLGEHAVTTRLEMECSCFTKAKARDAVCIGLRYVGGASWCPQGVCARGSPLVPAGRVCQGRCPLVPVP